MGSCAAPSAKGDDKFITTDYLQQCPVNSAGGSRLVYPAREENTAIGQTACHTSLIRVWLTLH
ncbi:hypothetical protein, partial [Escherichia coli]|uniref:hypothetical protein n=1 Tax=Escherichia coli TaxID=562 RepID=UPI00286085E3